MNWLILISDLVFASVAAILAALGYSTLRAIRHLGIGKSFWLPVSMSGAFFLLGSVFRIFCEVAVGLNLSLTIYSDEIVHVSWLLALCFLVCSIYGYSRRVKTIRTIPVLEEKVKEMTRVAVPEEKVKESLEKEAPKVCKHQFGYLETFPKDASVPDECLGCHRIVECARAP